MTHFLLLETFVPSPFDRRITRDSFSPKASIVDSIKLRAPCLYDLCQSLEEDDLDPLVKISYPVFQVGVSF